MIYGSMLGRDGGELERWDGSNREGQKRCWVDSDAPSAD
jgi:hypothetical protein